MSRPVATVTLDEALLDALSTMRERGVRRLVVTDADGMLAGLVSVQDARNAPAR